jgi:hypothetical protein
MGKATEHALNMRKRDENDGGLGAFREAVVKFPLFFHKKR